MRNLNERLLFLQGASSQADFSAKIGITQTRWGRFIRGETLPDSKVLQAICKACNVTPAWLLLGKEPMSSDSKEPSLDQTIADEVAELRKRISELEEGTRGLKAELHAEKRITSVYQSTLEALQALARNSGDPGVPGAPVPASSTFPRRKTKTK